MVQVTVDVSMFMVVSKEIRTEGSLATELFLNYNVLFLFVNSLVIACKLRSFYLSRLFYYN